MLEKIRVEKDGNVATIVFDLLPTDTISYSDLPLIVNKVYNDLSKLQDIDIVRITGRGPIWLYSAVVHVTAHLAKAVAVYDAINKKFVVVVSHNPSYHVGDTL